MNWVCEQNEVGQEIKSLLAEQSRPLVPSLLGARARLWSV